MISERSLDIQREYKNGMSGKKRQRKGDESSKRPAKRLKSSSLSLNKRSSLCHDSEALVKEQSTSLHAIMRKFWRDIPERYYNHFEAAIIKEKTRDWSAWTFLKEEINSLRRLITTNDRPDLVEVMDSLYMDLFKHPVVREALKEFSQLYPLFTFLTACDTRNFLKRLYLSDIYGPFEVAVEISERRKIQPILKLHTGFLQQRLCYAKCFHPTKKQIGDSTKQAIENCIFSLMKPGKSTPESVSTMVSSAEIIVNHLSLIHI